MQYSAHPELCFVCIAPIKQRKPLVDANDDGSHRTLESGYCYVARCQ